MPDILFAAAYNTSMLDTAHLTDFVLFALVARHQSFSRAASEARLSRSVVSERVQRLERHLGKQLLRRTTRRVHVTEAGLRLFSVAAPLLEEAERLSASAFAELEPRTVRVNAPANLLMAGLGRALGEAAGAMAGVALEVSVESRLVDLHETRADVVVRLGRSLPADVVARRLGKTRLVVVGAPTYLARHGRPETPEALLGHRCLHYVHTPREVEWSFDSPSGRLPVRVEPVLSSDDGELLREWAIAGLGLAVVPHFMVQRELESGALVWLLREHRKETLDCWAILTAGRLASKSARALVDVVARVVPTLL